MRIQHNIAALNSYRQLNSNNSAVAKNLEKLSSGYKINRAGDDAAGLAISEKMRAQITGLETAQSNAQDGISLIQTAEGNLQEVHSMLNRMVELATQSANGTYDNDVDRANLQKEVNSLSSEIDRIAESANFNGIKLLNGDLGKTALNSYTKTDGTENLADGIIIDAPIQGAGLKDEFTIGFDGLFGTGDSVTFEANMTDNLGNVTTKNIKLEYGTDFTGTDKKTQMDNMVTALKNTTTVGTATIADDYDVEVVTTATDPTTGAATDWQIKLTAKSEGVSSTKLSAGAITPADSQVIVSAQTTTVGTDSSADATAATGGGFDNLLGGATSGAIDLNKNDKLTFKANVNGKNMTVTLEAGKDFAIGDSIEDTTKNLVDALNAASFDDDSATGIDESQLKVSDYFTVTDNLQADGTTASEGSLQITNKTGAGITADTNTFGSVEVSFAATPTAAVTVVTGATIAAGTAATTPAVAAISEVKFDNDFMEGDSFTLRGTLRDGLSFDVTLKAGTDFAIGANKADTMQNIMDALSGATATTEVNITKNGTTATVNANELFGAGKEFTLATTATNDLTITSTVAGAGRRGGGSVITSANSTVADGNKVTNVKVAQTQTGKEKSNAVNTLTFDQNKIEQGTTITIGDKTYEFVNDDGTDNDYRTNSNNVAIKVANLNKRETNGDLAADAATNNDLANALVKAMDDTATLATGTNQFTGAIKVDGKDYTVTVDAGSSALKITSDDFGTKAVAVKDVEISSRDQNKAVIKFNTETTGAGSAQKTTANVKVGDTITVDGKTYEFTDGEHRTKTEGNVSVELNIKDGYTAEDAAKALADAINANTKADIADGKPGGVIATVGTVENSDGSRSFAVNVTSKYNDTKGEGHEYDAPVVEIPTSGKGLTLQVGETSEDFQKVNVAIDKMDAASLGIGDISVGKQPDAAAAIDKIKAAINTVSATRGDLGAIQNRLEHTINNLGVTTENMTAAESRIRDTDMAKEMMEFTKNNILVQASQAMLAQANQLPQGVLQLLQ